MSNSDFKQVGFFYPPKKEGSTMDKTHDFFCKILFTCIGLDKFYGSPKTYQSEKLPYPIQEKGNYFEPLNFNQDRPIVEYDEKFGSPGLVKPEQGMGFWILQSSPCCFLFVFKVPNATKDNDVERKPRLSLCY